MPIHMSKSSHLPPSESSRRTFLKKFTTGISAVALSGAGFSASSCVAKPVSNYQGKKLGIALVGLGNYATNRLAPALEETEYCKLAGIVTGTPEKAEKWKAKYDIPESHIYNYETFDQISENPDIDAVYIVLPNGMHSEYSIRGAKAGKHVFCEKPMANTVAEAEAMIAACKEAGKQLAIGYRLHFEPHNMEVMRLGQKEVYGKVKLIEAGFGFKIGDPTQWRLNKELAGGGAMMDVGIYVIQAARYVTGEEPIAITAQEIKTDPVKFKEVDETISWQMEFPSGVIASCITSYATGTNHLRVACENGWFELGPAYNYGPIKGKTKDGEMDLPHTNHQALHMDAVSQQILEGKPNTVPGEEGMKDMKVIEAIYKAIEKGERISLG